MHHLIKTSNWTVSNQIKQKFCSTWPFNLSLSFWFDDRWKRTHLMANCEPLTTDVEQSKSDKYLTTNRSMAFTLIDFSLTLVAVLFSTEPDAVTFHPFETDTEKWIHLKYWKCIWHFWAWIHFNICPDGVETFHYKRSKPTLLSLC